MTSARFTTTFLWVLPLIISTACRAQDGFARLATVTATPLFESFDAANEGRTDARTMLGNELAYQALATWSSSSSAVEAVRAGVYGVLSSCHDSLMKIRRLDASTPDFEKLATSALKALPALSDSRRTADGNLRPADRRNVEDLVATAVVQFGGWLWDQYEASEERTRYRRCHHRARQAATGLRNVAAQRNTAPRPLIYGLGMNLDVQSDGLLITELRSESSARTAGLAPGDKIVAVNGVRVNAGNGNERVVAVGGARNTRVALTVDRNGEKFDVTVPRAVAIREVPLLSVAIDGSVNGFYNSDYVTMTNTSGVDLNNVTLFVELKGRHGKDGRESGDSHIHYIDRWPSGTTKVARYLASRSRGISKDESVDQIDTLRYEIYSNEFSQENTVAYTGPAYDATLAAICDKLKLLGSWRSFKSDDWFFNSGFLLQNSNEGRAFPASHVTVRPTWGDTTVGFRWKMANGYVPSGTSDVPVGDRYFSDPAFNRGRPDSVEVQLRYDYSDFVCIRNWDLRN